MTQSICMRRARSAAGLAAIGSLLAFLLAPGMAAAQAAQPMAAPRPGQPAPVARAAAPHTLWTLTADGVLHRYSAAQPGVEQASRPVTGLPSGDPVVGIDFRVAYGQLYALTRSGRLYLLATDTGEAKPVAAAATSVPMDARETYGMNFNPVVDRLRVVNCAGQNFRLHPLTNEVVDNEPDTPGLQLDGRLVYAASDSGAGKGACVKAVAYTYNKRDPKLTSNYAIEASQGWLLLQGSLEGVTPVVLPHTGQLTTVGSLGMGRIEAVQFDIADRDNDALAAIRLTPTSPTQLYRIRLESGSSTLLGTLGQGAPVLGFAIEP
ncbi:DUF4394 domain-containing protein [uncultured Pseudacidovorax sp.]|uniref:DUF4394 domain-containing protein n=1 Tax=uncultured Pseudacidovorax sp. TaxID=679313 RepID=UPI0025E7E667|nr:DUF4394 domain-containing protein [uncultured Pseudacidovorax sp.]